MEHHTNFQVQRESGKKTDKKGSGGKNWMDEGYVTHGLGREMPDDGHKQTAGTWEED